MVKKKNNYIRGAKFFSEWHQLAKNISKAKRFRSHVLLELQFKVLKALYEYASGSKERSAIVGLCLQRYSSRLMRASLLSLSNNVQTRVSQRHMVA